MSNYKIWNIMDLISCIEIVTSENNCYINFQDAINELVRTHVNICVHLCEKWNK